MAMRSSSGHGLGLWARGLSVSLALEAVFLGDSRNGEECTV